MCVFYDGNSRRLKRKCVFFFVLFISPNVFFYGGAENRILFCGRVPWLYQYWPGGFRFLWFYVQEHPRTQPAVVLV